MKKKKASDDEKDEHASMMKSHDTEDYEFFNHMQVCMTTNCLMHVFQYPYTSP